ncbi:MAG: tetratricopeptide repeat protein [Polyangia bacterium]
MSRLVVVLILCWQVAAQAQRSDPLVQARAHYDAGRTFYDVGNYQDALREFNIGYELSQKPRFLLNIAQTHRKLNDFARAREALGKFLGETPADDPYRSTAEALLKEIDAAEIRQAPPATIPSVAPTPPPTPTPAPAPTVTPLQPAVVPGRAPVPLHKPLVRRGWLWGTVAGGVVLAGGAIALGVVLGGSSNQYPSGLKVPVQ